MNDSGNKQIGYRLVGTPIPAFIIAIVLMATTLLTYAPAYHAGFVEYDDPMYVTANEWVLAGISRESVGKMWTEHVAGNWHPLTMFSHLVDVSLHGLDPKGHHLTSLLLHAINSALLFALFRCLFGGLFRPALAAAIFALHPFNVDSAIWISQRKNLLSTFFWLGSTLLYVRFSRRPSPCTMIGVIVFFAAGLMSKPMLVTFPFTLLMLDYRPLKRVDGFTRRDLPQWKNLLQEKSALFILTVISTAITLSSQFAVNITHGTEQPLWARLLFSLQHYQMYLEKFFWPSGLCVLYPRLDMPPNLFPSLMAGLILLMITIGALSSLRRSPAWALGWFWFAGTLFPVIGLVSIGHHSIADRYMYVPMIGLLIALVWGVSGMLLNRTLRGLAMGLGLAAVIAGGLVTRSLIPHWLNSEALFRRSIAVTENNAVMHYNLGRELVAQKKLDEAIAEFETALQMDPQHFMAMNNLGWSLSLTGQDAEAVPYYEASLKLEPRNTVARMNLAGALMRLERYAEAARQFELLLASEPDNAAARDGLRVAKGKLGAPAGWMR